MTWLLGSIIVPFLTALACLVAARQPNWARSLSVFGAVLALGNAVLLFQAVAKSGYIVVQPGDWPAPFGITLVADLLAALMVGITAVVAVASAVYAWKEIPDHLVHGHFHALMHLLLMGVNGAFITGDLFNLYVWFEVMLLASFVLITLGGSRPQLEGGVKYLILNLLSSTLFLAAAGLLYGKLGTLNMADIAVRLAASPDAWLINSTMMLLMVAFGIKAALFPFFFWLPASYHTPAVVTSALFAGLLTKVGVYALMRGSTLLFHSQFEVIQGWLLFLAGATMVTGVFGAAVQFEIRKILSFHIVSQIGYIVMGVAVASPLALAGAIFYTLHHIVVKTNLFLIGGLIARRTGSEQLKEIGGLYRWAPGLALLFFVPAFSLGGIPPLSGFWAKFGVIRAGLEAGHYVLVATALLVGVLTLYSMTKIWGEAFWKEHPTREGAEIARQPMPRMPLAACVGLALITIGLGIAGEPVFAVAQRAADQLLDPQTYIQHVLTHETLLTHR